MSSPQSTILICNDWKKLDTAFTPNVKEVFFRTGEVLFVITNMPDLAGKKITLTQYGNPKVDRFVDLFCSNHNKLSRIQNWGAYPPSTKPKENTTTPFSGQTSSSGGIETFFNNDNSKTSKRPKAETTTLENGIKYVCIPGQETTLKKCNYCCNFFHGKGGLLVYRAHLADAHKEEFKYDCNICNKSFTSCSTLQRHLEAHGPKPTCGICGKSYSNKMSKTRHMRTVHKVTVVTNRVAEDVDVET